MHKIRALSLTVVGLALAASMAAPVAARSSAQVSVQLSPTSGGHAIAAKNFKNCTALNKVYHHGVGKPGAVDHVSGHTKKVKNFYVSLALYNANKGSDRDHDGIACEKL